ncbi:MAG: hypothetical protein OEY22_10805 [Candidatus Bathyarchaeota archaeon]|nr:hypothetical protein [Candidatus Bathyarchaeota archaeon]MDH5788637.1 hypothetical protein [Candidatus Bathyarchaeota archaeon]
MTRIDPMSNVGTSKVFLKLCSGPKNPKTIADLLRIKPPPAIEQLRRLQELKIVRLGQKIGRAQNYEIDWKAFLKLFTERAFTQKITHVESQKEKLKTLVENKYFEQFIKLYICRVLSEVTLLEAIQEFENGLLHSLPFKKKKAYDDEEKQEFFNITRLWYKRAQESMSICEITLQDALARTLNPKKFKDV